MPYTNYRTYWAIQHVGIAPESTTNYVSVHGVQTCGVTTTFNLEQVYELGQLELYQNIENLPDVEITLEKVLDGYPLMYHLATGMATVGTSLANRSTKKCNVALNIYEDFKDAASGTPLTQMVASGMYVSNLTYTFPVEGNCTEAVTLVGNNKWWLTPATWSPTTFESTDSPMALASGWGGVQRRQHVKFGSLTDGTVTLLPGGTNGVQGISSSGTNDQSGGQFNAHVQTITVTADLGREQLLELGRRGPYFRYITYPVQVSCDIEVTASQGDQISGTEEGIFGASGNVLDSRILIVTNDGTKLDLGTKNKLNSVTYGGADAGGGNATITYNYQNFNVLAVKNANHGIS